MTTQKIVKARRFMSTFFATTAIACFAYAALRSLLMHVLRPDYTPASHMISDYAGGRYGWVMTTAFLALSCGNLMLLLGLARIGPSSVVARLGTLLRGYRLYRLGGHGDLPDGPGRGAIDSHGRHPHDELPRKRRKHYPRGVLLSVSFGSDPRWH